jgi:hypothetical protein
MKKQTTLTAFVLSKGLLAIAFLSASLALMGCENEGPAEQAGEKIDRTTEKAGDKMEDAKQSLTD